MNGDQFQQVDSRTVMGITPNWLWTGKLGEMESIVKLGMQLRRDHETGHLEHKIANASK